MTEKQTKWEWEELNDGLGRVRIEGGWIYNTVKGSVFVPDPPIIISCPHCHGWIPKQ